MEWSLLDRKHGLLETGSGELTTFISSTLAFFGGIVDAIIGLLARMKWLPSAANRRARRLTDPYHVITFFSAYFAFIVRLEQQNESLFKDDLTDGRLFSRQLCAHVFTLSIVPASSGEEGSMSQFFLGMCHKLSNFVANF